MDKDKLQFNNTLQDSDLNFYKLTNERYEKMKEYNQKIREIKSRESKITSIKYCEKELLKK